MVVPWPDNDQEGTMRSSGFAFARGVFVAAALLGLSGLLAPQAAQAQAKPEKVTIRYGYLPVPTVPLFAAVAHDLLEKEGVDLQLIKFTSGPAAFQALQSGSIDAAQGGMPTYYMGTTRGLDVRWVYTYGDYSPIEGLVVPKGSAIKDFKELRGRKVAAPSGSMMHLAHLFALQRAGMTMKDMEFVPLQPPQGLAAVLNGDVDGAWFWDPFVAQAMEKGAQRIVINKELGMPDPFGFAVTTKFLSEQKNVEGMGRLLRALREGQRLFQKDPEPTLAAIQRITGIERPLATQLIKGVEWYTLEQQLDPDATASLADPSNMKKGAAAFLKDKVEDMAIWGGIITKRGDIPAFLDNRPARFALGK
jgi:ABC-type nitrate/sulfonate/bicarbonate transport system substrate-binding protein